MATLNEMKIERTTLETARVATFVWAKRSDDDLAGRALIDARLAELEPMIRAAEKAIAAPVVYNSRGTVDELGDETDAKRAARYERDMYAVQHPVSYDPRMGSEDECCR